MHWIAGTSKLVFIVLVLTSVRQFLARGVGTSVIADSAMVVLFALYLLQGSRRSPHRTHPHGTVSPLRETAASFLVE